MRFAIRALIIALWAIAAVCAPVHAAEDVVNDPCQQASVAAIDDPGSPMDLDEAFHAAHGCGTCHAHAVPAPTGPTVKPALAPTSRRLADQQGWPGPATAGPYRPPRV